MVEFCFGSSNKERDELLERVKQLEGEKEGEAEEGEEGKEEGGDESGRIADLEELEGIKVEKENVEKELEGMKVEKENVEKELEGMKVEKENVEKELEGMKVEKENVEKELEGMKVEKENVEKELEGMKVEKENVEKELEGMKVEKENVEKELETVKGEKETEANQRQAVQDELDEMKLKLKELQQELDAEKKQNQEVNVTLGELKVSLKAEQDKNELLESQVTDLQSVASNGENASKELLEKLAAAQAEAVKERQDRENQNADWEGKWSELEQERDAIKQQLEESAEKWEKEKQDLDVELKASLSTSKALKEQSGSSKLVVDALQETIDVLCAKFQQNYAEKAKSVVSRGSNSSNDIDLTRYFRVKFDDYLTRTENGTYTVYGLHVQIGSLGYTIYRRYSQFRAIHIILAKQFPKEMKGIEFPSRTLTNSTDDSFVTKRMAALQDYLDAVLSSPVMLNCLELLDLLEVNSVTQMAIQALTVNEKDKRMSIYDADNVDDFLSEMLIGLKGGM
eukprot:TRINITY_DN7651_c0_g1_i17.p1 TRINITY_DN7651_c0_g1~~TRINITY_DN7651_c0_g1_i17.p1  ORF type:complete len:512 (-),score=215.43 TRINITY_DN7651_c0_g1_i17:282-1817(-)